MDTSTIQRPPYWEYWSEPSLTANEFRKLALSLPDAVESAHMGHPDFRVGGKIFATLGPDEAWGMVKLATDEQASLVRAQPKVFEPFNGAWGRSGCTRVWLAKAKKSSVLPVLIAAWRKTAPKRLVLQYDQD